MALEPQAALETAVRDAIRQNLPYRPSQCDRTFDGEPPPRCGIVFVAVWWGGRAESLGGRTRLEEVSGVNVTITLRSGAEPFDRLLKDRDDMEFRANAIRALINKDAWDYRISRAAGVLANLDTPVTSVRYHEALYFQGKGDIELKGGGWFKADPAAIEVGLAQTLRFGGSKRIQAVVTEAS